MVLMANPLSDALDSLDHAEPLLRARVETPAAILAALAEHGAKSPFLRALSFAIAELPSSPERDAVKQALAELSKP